MYAPMRIHVCSPQLSHLPFVVCLYQYVKDRFSERKVKLV